eukprot:scaffold576368_cov14-Prasinocladus_malaysianus.AAC.1
MSSGFNVWLCVLLIHVYLHSPLQCPFLLRIFARWAATNWPGNTSGSANLKLIFCNMYARIVDALFPRWQMV